MFKVQVAGRSPPLTCGGMLDSKSIQPRLVHNHSLNYWLEYMVLIVIGLPYLE